MRQVLCATTNPVRRWRNTDVLQLEQSQHVERNPGFEMLPFPFFSPSRQIFVAAVLSSRAYSVRPDSRILYQHGKAVKNTAPKKGKRYHNGTYSVSNACWSLRSLVEAVESAGERVSESLRSPVSLPCGAKSIWRPLVQCYQCSSHFDCVGLLRRRLSKWTWVWISP